MLSWCSYLGGSAIDREEAAHESFVRLHEVLGDLRDPAAFSSFLYGIVLRVVREHRRRPFWVRWLDIALPERASRAPDPERAAALSQTARQLEGVLDSLSEPHREVLILCRIQGHTDAEAAVLLGVSPHTVRSRLSRARRRFEERCRQRGIATLEVT